LRTIGVIPLAVAALLVAIFLALALRTFQPSKTAQAPGPRVIHVSDASVSAPAGALVESVSQALAEAQAGDIIQFAAGREYHQPVRLKSGITFRGSQSGDAANGSRAILRLAPGATGPALLGDNVHGVRIQGLRILADPQAPLPQGVLLIDSSVEIDDSEIEGATIGVEVRGAGRLVMRASTIRDSLAEGLLASGPSSLWLSHNSFLHNHSANLAARDGAQPSLTGNVFDKSTLQLPPEVKMDSVRELNFLLDAKPTPARPGGRKQ